MWIILNKLQNNTISMHDLNFSGKCLRRLSTNWFCLEKYFWRFSIHRNCPDNCFQTLHINCNYPHNWFRRSINWNRPDNSFWRLSMIWNRPDNWLGKLPLNLNSLNNWLWDFSFTITCLDNRARLGSINFMDKRQKAAYRLVAAPHSGTQSTPWLLPTILNANWS